MSTHGNSKGKRSNGKRGIWNQSLNNTAAEQQVQKRIEEALRKAPNGLTELKLRNKEHISHPTAHKHLKGLEGKGLVKKENHCWIWITNWERKEAIKKIFEAVTQFLEDYSHCQNIGNGELFKANRFIITPCIYETEEQGFKVEMELLESFNVDPAKLPPMREYSSMEFSPKHLDDARKTWNNRFNKKP
jgi:hypothetical protein